MINVMIAAPAHDGRVDVWHTCALVNSAKLGLSTGYNLIPIYMSYDSLVQRARNDIVKLALEIDVDELVFIDTDQDWEPEDLFKLLEHDVDIVGGPVPKKSDIEQYNIKLVSKPYQVLDNGLVEVDSVGTGMMRLSKRAMQMLWDNSEEYFELGKEDSPSRMIFDVTIVDGQLWSEDVIMCKKWNDLGEKIYIDPSINSAHSGTKRWVGNFEPWIQRMLVNEEI